MKIFNFYLLNFCFNNPDNFEFHNYVWVNEVDEMLILDSSLN